MRSMHTRRNAPQPKACPPLAPHSTAPHPTTPHSTKPPQVRQLEALVRISESLARMELSGEATPEHVAKAFELFKQSTLNAMSAGLINTDAGAADQVRWGHDFVPGQLGSCPSGLHVCSKRNRRPKLPPASHPHPCHLLCHRLCPLPSLPTDIPGAACLSPSPSPLPLPAGPCHPQTSQVQAIEQRICDRLARGAHLSFKRLVEDLSGHGFNAAQVGAGGSL